MHVCNMSLSTKYVCNTLINSDNGILYFLEVQYICKRQRKEGERERERKNEVKIENELVPINMTYSITVFLFDKFM